MTARASAIAVPVGLVLVWQFVSSAVDYAFLPQATSVLRAFASGVADGTVPSAAAHTLLAALTATLAATAVGGAVGLAIGSCPPFARCTMAGVDFLRAIPAVALVPVVLLAIGPRFTAEVLLASVAATWPVVVTTAGGVAAVHHRHVDVARTLNLSRRHTLSRIVIPATVPSWLAGARLAAVVALLVSIMAEMLVYPRGLGGGLMRSFQGLDPATMWAYVLTCALAGVALNAVLRAAVRVAVPGAPGIAEAGTATVSSSVSPPASPPSGLVVIAALLAGWQLFGASTSMAFPPPGRWVRALLELTGEGVLLPALTETLTTFVMGLALATLVGGALGFGVGASAQVDRAVTPSMDFVAAVPAAALVPLVTLLVGNSRWVGALVVGTVAAFPIALNVATAVRATPAVRLDMSRTLGLPATRRWVSVIGRGSLPGLLLGVRVAAPLALIVTLLADIFGSGTGIGRLLVISQQTFDGAAVWGLLLVVGVTGYAVSVALPRGSADSWSAPG